MVAGSWEVSAMQMCYDCWLGFDELQIQDGDKIKIKKSFLIELAKILTSQH